MIMRLITGVIVSTKPRWRWLGAQLPRLARQLAGPISISSIGPTDRTEGAWVCEPCRGDMEHLHVNICVTACQKKYCDTSLSDTVTE
jgi:hypothetical protein